MPALTGHLVQPPAHPGGSSRSSAAIRATPSSAPTLPSDTSASTMSCAQSSSLRGSGSIATTEFVSGSTFIPPPMNGLVTTW